MPSTRQATPGPSSTPVESRDCLLSASNAKKRAGSEDVEDARHNKKIKVDGEPLSNLSMNAKDRKKKKKKKKKRISVVPPEVEPKERVKSKSRMPSNKPASAVKKEFITNGSVDDSKYMVQNEEPPPKSLNKGKGKARSNSPTSQAPTPSFSSEVVVASGSGGSNVTLPDSIDHASEIARLKQQVALQDILLQRHKVYLTQHQQALTCQICLDLMHKPFALAPCGHITCYNCLIRWFTALQGPNAAGVANDNANPLSENVDEVQLIVNSAEARRGTYLRRRKTCPVCRAAVLQRPIEMWSIKAMVATLVNSALMELPVPMAPPNSTTPGEANNEGDANNDPWRYIFQCTKALNNAMQVQDQANREDLGMYDIEDGGIYRCIDCLHEIWGGVCSGCNRGYPGHERDDDDDDEDDDVDLDAVNYLFRRGLRHQAHHIVEALHDGEVDDDEEDGYNQFWGDEDEDVLHADLHHHPVYPMQEYLFLSGDEGMTDSEGEGDDLEEFEIFDPFRPGFIGQPPLGGIARIDEGSDYEHESDYGGSFIDDNEEEEGGIVDDGLEVTELDASSDEERTRPRRLPQNRRQRQRPLVTSEDENVIDLDDNAANELLARYLGRSTRMGSRNPGRRRAAVLSTDDSRSSGEEPDDNDEAPARSRARLRRVMSDDE
ncbi:hypothetical protein BYT27DRAFT_7202503 [Phlegmacium glaucopus]|nr:hypothetical protein BYT27DRAFT_7202503 [Phlegmacium glaucopus]